MTTFMTGRERVRRLLRLVLLLASVGFAGVAIWNLWSLASSPTGQLLVARSTSQIEAAIKKRASRDATGPQIDQKIQAELHRDPRNWIVIDSLLLVAQDRGHQPAPELSARVEEARSQDHAILRMASVCAACAYDPQHCTPDRTMICGIAVGLTPVGDLAGLVRAGTAYVQGEEIDQIDAALSVVGLVATGAALASGGTSLTVKAGAGFLKFAHRAGKLPAPITRDLSRAASQGIDWRRLPAVRNSDELAGVVRMDALRPAIAAADAMGRLAAGAGPRQAFHLMEGAANLGDLRRTALASTALTDRTAGYFRLLGKSRVMRVTMRLADEVWIAISAMAGMITTLTGLVLSRGGSALSRALRRRLRDA